MTVARRFIAGSGTTWTCVPEGRPNTAARSIPKISFFKADTLSEENVSAMGQAQFRSSLRDEINSKHQYRR
jgi:hypothetical protein